MEVLPRNIRPLMLEALRESRVVCLVGGRQVGKSTLVAEIAGRDHPASFQTFDDTPTLERAKADPSGFVYSLSRPAVIDEIQRVPEILLPIKRLVDEEPSGRGQFLLTGSADIMTLPTVADALPGRIVYVELWPFSQGELAHTRELFLSALFDNDPPAIDDAPIGRQAYAERIAVGGFPEAQGRSPRGRAAFFEGYVSSLLARDIDDIAAIRDRDAARRLLRLLAARTSGLVDYAGLARDLGVAHKTAKTYVGALEQLFLVRRLEPWFANLGQRLIKTPKFHVTDTGLLAYLVRANAQSIAADDGLAGRAFETFVVGEITRQATWFDDTLHLYHYRDKAKREVDLLVERNDGVLCGIEVKASATVRMHDLRGLAYLRDRLGNRFRSGIILYTGRTTIPFGDRLWAVPVEGLWSPGKGGRRG